MESGIDSSSIRAQLLTNNPVGSNMWMLFLRHFAVGSPLLSRSLIMVLLVRNAIFINAIANAPAIQANGYPIEAPLNPQSNSIKVQSISITATILNISLILV